MSRSNLAVLFILATLLPGIGPRHLLADNPAASLPEEAGLSSSVLARVKPALQKFVDDGKVAGAVVVVSRNGRIALHEAVGWRDLEGKKPMQHDTLFRIYSMTKPITSVAVMMLVEQGNIDLDAPVEKYLPELRERDVLVKRVPSLEPARRKITTRDLLRHTSGLTYGFFGETEVDKQYLAANILSRDATLAEMLAKLERLPLVCHPGEKFCYSVSTDVLARLVEVVSGQPFDAYLDSKIFQPLGMTDTAFSVSEARLPRFANNYGPGGDGKLRVVDAAESSDYRKPPKLLSGGGGLVSTGQDYARFCQMLLGKGQLGGKRLLRPETVGLMTSNQLVASAYPISVGADRRPGVGFGLGFSVVVEKLPGADYVPIGEYGWGGAASTHFWVSPNDNLAVVVLSQIMPFTFQLEAALKPIIYEAVVRMPK